MQLGCRLCSRITNPIDELGKTMASRITNPIDELGTTMASRITNSIDELGTTMTSRRGQRAFSCRSVVKSRSSYTCVLGQRGSKGSRQNSFVVRCLCNTGLLWATSASDVLHGLTISPLLQEFAQSVLISLSPVKGVVRRHLGWVQSIVRQICRLKAYLCRFSGA